MRTLLISIFFLLATPLWAQSTVSSDGHSQHDCAHVHQGGGFCVQTQTLKANSVASSNPPPISDQDLIKEAILDAAFGAGQSAVQSKASSTTSVGTTSTHTHSVTTISPTKTITPSPAKLTLLQSSQP